MSQMEGSTRSADTWIAEAVARYEAPLVAYATRITRDRDTARDVVQETFTRLCARDPAALEGHLGGWLYTVARNLALDSSRKRRREIVTDKAAAAVASPEPPVAARVELDDETAAALRAIAELPQRQQEALRLRFQGGLSYKEIADVMGTTVSNVGFMLHTALARVRELLEGHDRSTATEVAG